MHEALRKFRNMCFVQGAVAVGAGADNPPTDADIAAAESALRAIVAEKDAIAKALAMADILNDSESAEALDAYNNSKVREAAAWKGVTDTTPPPQYSPATWHSRCQSYWTR